LKKKIKNNFNSDPSTLVIYIKPAFIVVVVIVILSLLSVGLQPAK